MKPVIKHSIIWIVFLIIGALLGAWWISTHPIHGVSEAARYEKLGNGFGFGLLGLLFIWLHHYRKRK